MAHYTEIDKSYNWNNAGQRDDPKHSTYALLVYRNRTDGMFGLNNVTFTIYFS